MAKRSASSVLGKRVAASATPTRRKIDYFDIPASTPEQLRKMTRVRRRIDFSDIPELTPAQLRAGRRIGRPPLGARARRLIAIRLDDQLLAELQTEAATRKIGYQTLIHEILTNRHAR